MNYMTLDAVLEKWAQEYGLILHREWAGEPAHYIYISSDRGAEPGECYQISIELESRSISVWAGSIERWELKDVERSWKTDPAGFAATLTSARRQILKWMRGKPIRSIPPEVDRAISTEDAELNRIADERAGQALIRVDLTDD